MFKQKKFRHNFFDPQKGHVGPKLALLGPQGAQKRDDTRPKCVVTMSLTQAEQSVAVGTKFGPPGPSLDLWSLQKGHFGPKLALLGPQGTQKRDDTRPKCVETMSLTQAEQSVAVGTKFGPPGPPLALWGPQKGHFGPKLALSGPQGAQKRADIRPKCVVNM